MFAAGFAAGAVVAFGEVALAAGAVASAVGDAPAPAGAAELFAGAAAVASFAARPARSIHAPEAASERSMASTTSTTPQRVPLFFFVGIDTDRCGVTGGALARRCTVPGAIDSGCRAREPGATLIGLFCGGTLAGLLAGGIEPALCGGTLLLVGGRL